jgi:hypothetical protein
VSRARAHALLALSLRLDAALAATGALAPLCRPLPPPPTTTPLLPPPHCHKLLICHVQDLKERIHCGPVWPAVALQQNLHVPQLAKVKVALLLQRLHLQV